MAFAIFGKIIEDCGGWLLTISTREAEFTSVQRMPEAYNPRGRPQIALDTRVTLSLGSLLHLPPSVSVPRCTPSSASNTYTLHYLTILPLIPSTAKHQPVNKTSVPETTPNAIAAAFAVAFEPPPCTKIVSRKPTVRITNTKRPDATQNSQVRVLRRRLEEEAEGSSEGPDDVSIVSSSHIRCFEDLDHVSIVNSSRPCCFVGSS